MLATFPFPAGVKDLTVTVIDVGQGDAILVEFPGKAKMLIDAGGLPAGTFDIGENVVSPVLWDKGIKRIDILVLSHAHADHLNGLPAVARNFRVGEFWEGTPDPREPAISCSSKALDSTPRPPGRPRLPAGGRRRGNRHDRPARPDRVRRAGQRFVRRASGWNTGRRRSSCPGISDGPWKKRFWPRGATSSLRSSNRPTMGARSSSTDVFLSAVRPDYIVISAGRGNRSGLPHPDVLSRYERSGARVFRTDLLGAVEFRSDGRRFSIRAAGR
ncbi:MAG: MBL fold metallo-hydrolase [Marinilabiliales bacterium]|nr:MBL fold metallo-hydrolase [Marinilabiliales bacterium]